MKVLIVALSCLLCCGQLRAQGTEGTFRSGVDLVSLNVIVTDNHDKFISGLTQKDFSVFEDGIQQDVSFFAAANVPLDLAVLLDMSSSMSDKMATVQEAAIGFASHLHDGDRISVIGIRDSARTLHELDGDVKGACEAIRRTTAGGGTALYNAIYTTLKQMQKVHAVDGNVRRQAIALTSQKYFSESEFAMRSLAQETGARAFFPTDIGQLAGVYTLITDELSNQYALGYTSNNRKQDGSFRHINVRVDEPNVRTRTRSGYQVAKTQLTLR